MPKPLLAFSLSLALAVGLLAGGAVAGGGGGGSKPGADGHKPSGTADSGSKGVASNTPYIVLDALPISVIRDGAAKGILVVEIGLDGKTMDGRHKIEHMMPRLRDLYIRVLSLYASRDQRLQQPPDPALIKKRLQMATDEVLGPDKAVVLLRQVLARRTQ